MNADHLFNCSVIHCDIEVHLLADPNKVALIMMECYPYGNMRYADKTVILVSSHFQLAADHRLTAEQQTNDKFACFVYQVAHIITPMINILTRRRETAGTPGKIGEITVDGGGQVRCGLRSTSNSVQWQLYGGIQRKTLRN